MGLRVERVRWHGLGHEAAHDRDSVRVPVPLLVLHDLLLDHCRLVRGRTAPPLRLLRRRRRLGRRTLALRRQRHTLQRNSTLIMIRFGLYSNFMHINSRVL